MTGTTQRPHNSLSQMSAKVPPWLWLWIIFYISSLPRIFSQWQKIFNDFFYYQEPSSAITGTDFFFLLRLTNLLELIPAMALFFSILSLPIPTLRKTLLENKYKLNKYEPTSIPAVIEISNFIHLHAPGIKIKANPTNFDESAFVYSLGYRKAAIAILAPLIRLWRSDRSMAESILLHEVAHYNHGDAFIVGAGSLFRTVIDRWFYLFLILFLLPMTIVFIDSSITFFRETTELVNELELRTFVAFPIIKAILFKIWQVILAIPLMLGTMLSLLLFTLNMYTIPLAGIWSSEFNADRFSVQHSQDSMLKVVELKSSKLSLLKWFLKRLTHPPNFIRRWFISNSQLKVTKVILIVFFPLSYILALVFQVLFAMLQASLSGISIESLDLGSIVAYVLHDLFAPRWLIMAIFILLWCYSSHIWEQWFTKIPKRANKLESSIYLSSALIVGSLALIGFLFKT